MKEYFKDVQVDLLKLIGAVFLVFAGAYTPTLAEKPTSTMLILGAIFSALGGALAPEAFKNTKSYIKEISPRINSINRSLATATSKISSIVSAQINGANNALVAERIAEIVPFLRAAMVDLGEITGTKFDPSMLNETLDSLGNLITKLEHGGADAESVTSLKDIYQGLTSQSSAKTQETINCPHQGCGEANSVNLGVLPGSSALPTCHKCGKKFHAHRAPDGTTFTKLPGKPAAA
ncbi:hypothetical protein [Acinetobacter sp.]|uniref:hypothetical protein n=1 Tax=Acinetobacter sp. TaxID=472 RepID=UPI0035B46B2E